MHLLGMVRAWARPNALHLNPSDQLTPKAKTIDTANYIDTEYAGFGDRCP